MSTKLSALSSNSSPTTSDFLVGVLASLASDDKVTIQNILGLLVGGNVLSNALQSYTPTVGAVTTGASAAGGTSYYINLGGIKIAWLNIACTNTSAGAQYHVTGIQLPPSFFTTIQTYMPVSTAVGNAAYQVITGDGAVISTGAQFYVSGTFNISSITVAALVIGT